MSRRRSRTARRKRSDRLLTEGRQDASATGLARGRGVLLCLCPALSRTEQGPQPVTVAALAEVGVSGFEPLTPRVSLCLLAVLPDDPAMVFPWLHGSYS